MAWGNYRGLIPGFFLTFFWVFAGNIPRIAGFTGFPKIPGFTGVPRIPGFTGFPKKTLKKILIFFLKVLTGRGKDVILYSEKK
jgi:hypothetical protein